MRTKLSLAVAGFVASTSFANADDLKINGFINVTGGVLDNKELNFDDYDTGVSFDNGTLMGLQLSKKVNDKTSATVQLISRGTQGYETEASWAYVTYAVNENTDIRAGRLRTPIFYYSDFLEVGYAYNWSRPPSIVYRLDGLSSLTGVDLTHRFSAGAVDGSIQVYSGRYNDEFALNGDVYDMELRRLGGAVLNLSSGNFGARVSYHQADLTLGNTDGTALGTLFNIANSATFGVGEAFTAENDTSKFYQASLSYDNGSTSVIAEWTSLKHDSAVLNDDTAWMVSAAQRFGDVTAHLTYSYTEDDLKSGTVGTVQKLAELEASNITLGLRYDYDSSAALKVEAHYITNKDASSRSLANPNAALHKETGMLYTVGMSIVF